ncbi:glycosyltransferase [Victivallis lenta]|uniref:glycosyltransferase n=1 Tax=Victivallis lenta TaxID=2606640 RepID=UPI0015B1DC01|nr:glycosyltransferase [Victivallis lenta]
MKILHVNYHASGGGAALAARRLHEELLRQGCDSRMLVVEGAGTSSDGVIRAGTRIRRVCRIMQRLEHLLLRLDGGSRNCLPRSLNLLRTGIAGAIRAERPDLVHLHWVNGAMFGVRELAGLGLPVVWTLHDGWAFCGCEHHHSAGDERFRSGYRSGSDFWNVWNWRRKLSCWRDWRFRSVAPSGWLMREAAESILLNRSRPVCIPNGVDLGLFSPGDRAEARRRLGIPEQGRMILFGAASVSDPNKGGPELLYALRALAARKECRDVTLLLLGRGELPEKLPFPVIPLGFVGEERRLAACYRAADLFVLASKYDNLPNMLIEAAACGTPLAAFDIGGISDIVIPGRNGFLAPPFDAGALADAIAAVLESPQKLGAEARAHAERHFDIRRSAEQYRALYEAVLRERR